MFSKRTANARGNEVVDENSVHDVVVHVMDAAVLQGLPAQVNEQCRVLVLGSMPGAVSLHEARYYAHPRNRFWPVMAALCGFDAALDYPGRMQRLQRAGIGVWDVIGQCRRSGSLDAAIVRGSEVPNPLPGLIAALPALQAIACNGAAAHAAFQRWVAPALPSLAAALPVFAMPSTSPANAAWSLPRLLEAWGQLRPWLPGAPSEAGVAGAGRP